GRRESGAREARLAVRFGANTRGALHDSGFPERSANAFDRRRAGNRLVHRALPDGGVAQIGIGGGELLTHGRIIAAGNAVTDSLLSTYSVEKLIEGNFQPSLGGLQSIDRPAIVACRPFCEVGFSKPRPAYCAD